VTRSRAALLTLTSSSSESFRTCPLVDAKQTSLALVFVTGQAFFRSINDFIPSALAARSTVSHGIPIFRISIV
jgi:hypothetical protein